MRRSTERILTTHVGSLPCPADLREMWSTSAHCIGMPNFNAEVDGQRESVFRFYRLINSFLWQEVVKVQ